MVHMGPKIKADRQEMNQKSYSFIICLFSGVFWNKMSNQTRKCSILLVYWETRGAHFVTFNIVGLLSFRVDVIGQCHHTLIWQSSGERWQPSHSQWLSYTRASVSHEGCRSWTASQQFNSDKDTHWTDPVSLTLWRKFLLMARPPPIVVLLVMLNVFPWGPAAASPAGVHVTADQLGWLLEGTHAKQPPASVCRRDSSTEAF